MAYTYIDNLAFPGCTDDGPHASAWLYQCRENLLTISADRRPGAGICYQAQGGCQGIDGLVRACSVWPTARGPFWVYSPEVCEKAVMQVRLAQVDWSAEDTSPPADATPAVRLAITAWQLGSVRRPGEDDWTVVNKDSGAPAQQTVTLECPLYGMSGWVGIMLWVWSYSLPEDGAFSQPITQLTMLGHIMLDSGGNRFWRGIGAVCRPPERAIGIMEVPGWKGDNTALIGELRQVCDYSADGELGMAEDVLMIAPPMDDHLADGDLYSGDQTSVVYYTMGVACIEGLSVQFTPMDPPIPGPRSCYTDAPVEEDAHQAMLCELNRLCRERVETLMCHQGQSIDPVDTTCPQEWPILSANRSLQISQTAVTYRYLASTMLCESSQMHTDNIAGFTANLAVYAQATKTDRGNDDATITHSPVLCDLYLGLYDLGDPGIVEHTHTIVPIYLHPGYNLQTYDPLAQTFFYANARPFWQLRGALCSARQMGVSNWYGGEDLANGDDLQLIQVISARVGYPTAEITGPLELYATIATVETDRNFDLMLISAGFAYESLIARAP